MNKNRLVYTGFLITTALALNSCAPKEAQGKELKDESKSKTNLPAPLPQFEITPTSYAVDILSTEIPAQIPEENLIIDRCVLPFEGAQMETGLRFGMPILDENGKQEKDKEGRPLWHLGQDFNGNSPEGGETVFNMCKTTVLFTGDVSEGAVVTNESQKSLGNVFVGQSKYLDSNGIEKEIVIVYAHLREVIDIAPGTVLNAGETIGILGNSGGWKNAHLHVHMWTKEAWDIVMNSEDIAGNILRMSGFYPDSEHNIGQIENEFIDPRKFLLSHLNTK